MYQIEELCTGLVSNVQISQLRFYHDSQLDVEAIMFLMVSFEMGIQVCRLVLVHEYDSGFVVQVCWKGLYKLEGSFKPVSKVHEEVPSLFNKLLLRKDTPFDSLCSFSLKSKV